MKQLNKHKLDFDLTWKYIQDQLSEVNALSDALLNLLDFKSGYFFTLLPDDANLKEICHFKWGGILPQFPEQEQIADGRRSTYSWIPNIRHELSKLILKEISSKDRLFCIMDDVSGIPKDTSHPCFSDNYSVFYDTEVYSLIKKDNVSGKLILDCMRFSNSFWHSLCVFTTADFIGTSKMLSLEKIKEISLTTELVMVGAYDGEGYVFWEKNLTGTNNGFFKDGNLIHPCITPLMIP